MEKIKIAVCGSSGRMGLEVVNAVLSDENLELVAKIKAKIPDVSLPLIS